MKKSINIPFGKLAVAAVVMGLGASACTPDMAQNRTLDSVHQPVISRTNLTLDLDTSPSQGLNVAQQQQLANWFEAMDLGYGDRVSIDDPAGRNPAVTSAVSALASRHGILVSDTAPITEGSILPGQVRVVVTRSTARVPGCPDWSTKSETNFNNGTSSNYGCATNSNLANMVANPEDLVRGERGSADAATGTRAIRTYRDAQPTGAGGLQGSSSTEAAGGGQ